jgi:hypothetical protein
MSWVVLICASKYLFKFKYTLLKLYSYIATAT